MEDWPEALPAFSLPSQEVSVMNFFVGVDVSKEKFDACCTVSLNKTYDLNHIGLPIQERGLLYKKAVLAH